MLRVPVRLVGSKSQSRRILKASLLALALFAPLPVVADSTTSERTSIPNTVLWAWQRKENLAALNPKEFGVAYLACHVFLKGEGLDAQWRQQSMKVPKEAALIPVVRIDTDQKLPPALSDRQVHEVANILVRVAHLPQTSAVQIDFDAKEIERPFYRRLIEQVRAALPSGLPLSITSLASWCLFDGWIKDLPVDETVPMMFSLGRERAKILLYFRSNKDFLQSGCCRSLGLSLEDTEVNALMIPRTRQRKIPVRVYVFTKTPWNENKIQSVHSMLSNP